MKKCYSQQDLIDGLNKTLNDRYQEDRAKTFDPRFDTQNIKDHYQELLNSYVRDFREAQANYIPSMKEDIVFGDDKWSARERFNNQKKQLYSALCAGRAQDRLLNTIDELEQSIEEVNRPFTVDEDSFRRAYAEYQENTINNIVNKSLRINQRKADLYKRKRARFVGLMVPGIVLACLFVGFAVYFWHLFSIGFEKYRPYLDLETIGIIFDPVKGDKTLGQNLGFAISFSILTLAGIGMTIPAGIYNTKRRKYIKTYGALSPMIKEDLNVASQQLIEDYKRRYSAMALESESFRKAANDTMVGCLNVFKKHRDSDPSFQENYVFCRNLPFQELYCLYDYMEKGVVDSYTGALQYFNNEVQKEMDRQATEQYRQQMVNMNKEHYSKMESAAQEQAFAASQQAEAAARQARAAADAAYYARIQAEESKKQTKEMKKQTNTIKKW